MVVVVALVFLRLAQVFPLRLLHTRIERMFSACVCCQPLLVVVSCRTPGFLFSQ